jgi:hypothetical protein
MLSILIGLIDPVSRIFSKIADAKVALANASTDQEKIKAEERIKALEANKDVLVAEAAGSRVNQYVRVALSIPAIFILWKLEIWDRALDWGSTPKLSVEEWTYIWMVCGFYLLNRVVQVAKR